MSLRNVLKSKTVPTEPEQKKPPKIIETTEEIRPCKCYTKGPTAIITDQLQKKEVYSDKSIRWTCRECGRRSYNIFVPYTPRKKVEKPDWLKTWQKK